MLRQFMDLCLKLHQRRTHVFDLVVGKRAALHTPDRLPLQQLPQELDQAEHKPRQPLLDVLRRTVDARLRQRRIIVLGGHFRQHRFWHINFVP